MIDDAILKASYLELAKRNIQNAEKSQYDLF